MANYSLISPTTVTNALENVPTTPMGDVFVEFLLDRVNENNVCPMGATTVVKEKLTLSGVFGMFREVRDSVVRKHLVKALNIRDIGQFSTRAQKPVYGTGEFTQFSNADALEDIGELLGFYTEVNGSKTMIVFRQVTCTLADGDKVYNFREVLIASREPYSSGLPSSSTRVYYFVVPVKQIKPQ